MALPPTSPNSGALRRRAIRFALLALSMVLWFESFVAPQPYAQLTAWLAAILIVVMVVNWLQERWRRRRPRSA